MGLAGKDGGGSGACGSRGCCSAAGVLPGCIVAAGRRGKPPVSGTRLLPWLVAALLVAAPVGAVRRCSADDRSLIVVLPSPLGTYERAYPERVISHSPGSRSAPWVNAARRDRQPQRGCIEGDAKPPNPTMKPLRGMAFIGVAYPRCAARPWASGCDRFAVGNARRAVGGSKRKRRRPERGLDRQA